ncbi:hypothetical protein ACO0RG_000155 [Hanseniaspora osmophila]
MFGNSGTSGSSGFSFGAGAGNTGTGNTSASGGMFGKPTTTPGASTGGGLFGQQNATNTSTATGGLFGNNNTNAGAAPSGGLFGKPTGTTTSMTSTAPTGGLFGNTGANTGTTAANSSTVGGGLFGNNNANPTSTGGGLFGNKPTTTNSTGGGLFGASTASNTGTGLFGKPTVSSANNNLGGAGLFGQQNQQNQPASGAPQQPMQSQTGGIFGKTTQPSFAWSNNNAHLQQQQQQQNSLLQQQQQQHLQQQQQQQLQQKQSTQYSANYPQQIQEQLLKLQQQWLPVAENCKFKGFVYNKMDTSQQAVLDLQKPSNAITQNEWEQALKDRPGEEYLPLLIKSPTDLQERIALQTKTVAQYRQIMNTVIYEQHLSQLKDKHNLDTTIRLSKCQTKLRDLESRLWKLNCTIKTILEQSKNYKFEINSDALHSDYLDNHIHAGNKGDSNYNNDSKIHGASSSHYSNNMFGMPVSGIDNNRVPLDEYVQHLVKQSEDPSSLGKVQSGELWARLSLLKERCKVVLERLDGTLGSQNGDLGNKGEEKLDREDGHEEEEEEEGHDARNDEAKSLEANIDAKLASVLNVQQDGLMYLNKVLLQDLASLKELNSSSA